MVLEDERKLVSCSLVFEGQILGGLYVCPVMGHVRP